MGKKIRDAKDKIEEIKRKSGEKSFRKYANKLKLRQKHQEWSRERGSVLKSLFGVKAKSFEENIYYWNGEIEELEEYKD